MLIRRTVVPILAAPLLFSFAAATRAEAPKPLAVVAFSGYSELKDDIAYVGRISGQPDLATGLEFMAKLFLAQGKDFPGLDKDRPWGAVIQMDHQKLAQGVQAPEQFLSGFAFLPVTDLKALLGTFEHLLGKPEDAGDGVLKIGRAPKPAYVKEVNGWAYLADKPEAFAEAPSDPGKFIAGLDGQYDLAFRVNVASLPDEIRGPLLEGLTSKAQGDLQRRPGEPEGEYIVRKVVGEYFLRAVTGTMNDLDHLTVGWALDHENATAYMDVNLSARPGTPSARQFAAWGEATTNFGGVMHPEATVAWNWTGKMHDADASNLASAVEVIRTRALDDFQNQGKSGAETELGKKLINGVLDVIQKTVQTGRVDGGGSLVLKPDAVTVVAGGFVADGAQLEQALDTLVEAVRVENPAFAAQAINMDAGEQAGVKLHTVSVPVPAGAEDRERVVRMIGRNIDVVVGVGDQSVYLAVGKDPMAALREVIQRSEHERSSTVAPLRVSVALRALTNFVAEVGEKTDQAQAAALRALLENAEGKDHVNVVASAIDRGVRLRIEIEQGILEAVGNAARQKRQGKGA
jgi:hypothetical protein